MEGFVMDSVNETSIAASTDVDSWRNLGLSGVANARDFGGYATRDGGCVKRGLLLRSGRLNDATKADIKVLSGRYALRNVIDLRSEHEADRTPDPSVGDARYELVLTTDYASMAAKAKMPGYPFGKGLKHDTPSLYKMFQAIGASYDNLAKAIGALYLSMAKSDFSHKAVARVFEILLEPVQCVDKGARRASVCDAGQGARLGAACGDEPGAVLLHCTSGKDRTGMIEVLILLALGVSREDAVADYMLTNEYLSARINGAKQDARGAGYGDDFIRALQLLEGVQQPMIDMFLDAILQQYGSMEEYFDNAVGLDEAKRAALHEIYVE
jgi:protein-tyrosine phosphatase